MSRRIDVLRQHLCQGAGSGPAMVKEMDELTYSIQSTADGSSKIATITLNAPKRLNSIGETMLYSFDKALRRIESGRDGARCLVITGAGRGFCAGANLTGGGGASSGPPGVVSSSTGEKSLILFYNPLLTRLRKLNVPIVAVVNGPCAGVGMSFAMAADMCICSDKAYFLQAFRNIGLVPDGGATYLLPRKVGWARAMELTLLGERLHAPQALEYGLVSQVFPQHALMDEGMRLAEKLATGPTKTLGMIRSLMWQSWSSSFEEQLQLEAESQAVAIRSEDAVAAMGAFGKRDADGKKVKKPAFRGK